MGADVLADDASGRQCDWYAVLISFENLIEYLNFVYICTTDSTMKNRFAVLLSLAASLTFGACVRQPDDYSAEIDDAVRYYIANAEYFASNPHAINAVFDLADSIYVEVDGNHAMGDRFKRTLSVFSAKGNNIAGDMLSVYDSVTYRLSDYVVEIPGERWACREMSRGVDFLIVTLSDYRDGSLIFRCTPRESSYTSFVERRFFDTCDNK